MKNIKTIVKILGIIAIGSASILAASFFSNPKQNNNTVSVRCPSDTKSYESIKNSKNIILLSDKSSYGINGSFDGHIYTVPIIRTGLKSQIACGYLYYRINIGNKPIDLDHEGLYMVPSEGKQFGGHIIPDEKNAIVINNTSTSTEFLIPLNNISYDGTTRTNIKQADWSSLLNR